MVLTASPSFLWKAVARSAGGWLCALSPSPNPLPFGHPPSLGRGEMVFHRFSLLPLEGGGAQRRRLASLSHGRRWRVAPEVGFALSWKEVARSTGGWLRSLSPSAIPLPFGHARHLHSQPLPIKKRTPASESANPSSQHQLDGSIVLILAKRRKVNHS